MEKATYCQKWSLADPVERSAVDCAMEYGSAMLAWKPDFQALPTIVDPRKTHNWQYYEKAGRLVLANACLVKSAAVWVRAQFVYSNPSHPQDFVRPWQLSDAGAWNRFYEYVRRERISRCAKDNKAAMDAEDSSRPARTIIYEAIRLVDFARIKSAAERRVAGKFVPLDELLRDGWILEAAVPDSAFCLNRRVHDLAPWRSNLGTALPVYRAIGDDAMKKLWGDDYRPDDRLLAGGK